MSHPNTPSTPHRRSSLSTPDSTPALSSRTPGSDMIVGSPMRSAKRKLVFSDRFIPSRTGIDLATAYQYSGTELVSPSKSKRKTSHADSDAQKEEAAKTYGALLQSELLGFDPPLDDAIKCPSTPSKSPARRLFTFQSPSKPASSSALDSPTKEKYSLSPMRMRSQDLLLSPRKMPRHISKTPYKVLDAPELQDDFYLNLVDWSSTNILGVGLGTCVYLWNATSSKVTKLCDLGPYDTVTSVNWMQKGSHVAVGTNRGFVQLWDVSRVKKIRQFRGHMSRVGTLAWNDNLLTSGSRDRLIYHRDIRTSDDWVKKLTGHRQEVCGLKWNPEYTHLASGGNDNKLYIWDRGAETPTIKFTEHTAAVKAIAWSPHQHGLLASGGGTADRRIRFWNTLTGNSLNSVDTGSQVCNLAWSKNANEIVSTHGYSQHQIVIWKYPAMQQIATLTGHSYRVLYLAVSPDGQNIVTGAGDETLRFWNVFNKGRSNQDRTGILGTLNQIR